MEETVGLVERISFAATPPQEGNTCSPACAGAINYERALLLKTLLAISNALFKDFAFVI
jgi:hypothetical protein